MEKLIKDVEQWVIDKGIKDKATTKTQWDKMSEEVSELKEALIDLCNDDNHDNQYSAFLELGDVVVTCIAMSMLLDTNIEQVLQMAYDKISKRTGRMINGTFVKSEDL